MKLAVKPGVKVVDTPGYTTSVALDSATDLAGFRAAARALLAKGTAPENVRFDTPSSCQPTLFDDAVPLPLESWLKAPAMALPAGFMALCETVVLHDHPLRFHRLYALLHALHHRQASWHDRLRPERIALEHMAQAVRREIHKMKAFVRFRPVQSDEGVTHVAWFEPAHHIVHAAAPFFVHRFAGMRWALLTPRGSAFWSGTALSFGPAAERASAPAADAGEALWLAYYRSIFNPARLKLSMMKREMPVRFWANLPEAAGISAMAAAAPERAGRMVQEGAAPRTRGRSGACASQARGTADTKLFSPPCERCEFAAQATQVVWGEGPPGAPLMLVGDQPDEREDLEGRPFVGPAGQLLRNAIRTLGWDSSSLYLTNAVKHFKFEWRGRRRIPKSASETEALACADWLEAEIAEIRPRAIVALGTTALKSLLGPDSAVDTVGVQWLQRRDGLPVLALPHPASLLDRGAVDPADDQALWLRRLAAAGRYLHAPPARAPAP